MTITQIIDIPDTRLVTFLVPKEIPTGRTNVIIQFPEPVTNQKTGSSERELTAEEEARLKVMPNRKMTPKEEKEFMEINAEWLNKEAADVLRYQADIWDFGEPVE